MSRLVTASIHLDLPGAYVARSLLEQHGIPAFLFDQGFARMDWFVLLALGGIRVMVPERDAEASREILGDLSDRIDVPEDEHCPACGSDDLSRPASLAFALATMLTLGTLLVRSRRRHCRACKHGWLSPEGFLV